MRRAFACILCLFLFQGLSVRAEENDIESDRPGRQGIDSARLTDLASYVLEKRPPVYSILLSRNGKLVFELYTSGLKRDHAHYLMSITKSITATLIGIAIDRGEMKGLDTRVSDLFDEDAFASPEDRNRFEKITLRNVLSMSALDALVPPHRNDAAAVARNEGFHAAHNRALFALTQPILAHPGSDFQYQDITPAIAIGALAFATQKRPFDYLREHIMQPMRFKNAEWMHRDPDGVDLASYGIRLRPVDMQKFGILYLQKGIYRGRRILSEAWVRNVYEPVIKTSPSNENKNYGSYFWHRWDGPNFRGIAAAGWHGQRIAIYPESGVVLSTTGWHADEDEEKFMKKILEFVMPAVLPEAREDSPADLQRLDRILARVNREVNVIRREAGEERMIPSMEPLE